MNDRESAPLRHSSARPALIAIVVICVLPALIAWLLVVGIPAWRPAQLVVHGELYTPPRPLPAIAASLPGGRELRLPGDGNPWLLALVVNGACTAPCVAALEALRRAQLATGKHTLRLQRVLLQAPDAPPAPRALLEPQPPAAATRLPPAAWSAFAPLLRTDTAGAPAATVMVIDPGGQAVVRYPPEFPFTGFVDDLKRLLGVASGGRG